MGRLARISNETIQRIAQLKEQGYCDSVIAERLGISMSSVQRYLRKQNQKG